MKRTALEHLVCPACGLALELEVDCQRGGEILDGRLLCQACARTYPIQRGVPSFVETSGWSREQEQTRESFSYKWRSIPTYRHTTESFYNNWFFERYGFGSLNGLRQFLSPKACILDAGTGTGRDSKMYAEQSEATVFGIDIGDGIYVAYEDLGHLPNLHLVQADLTCLPFRRESFDLVACDQVIHHTPDTRTSFNYLLEFVRPGGHFLTYVYKKKGPIREFCDDLLRAEFAERSLDECMRLSRAITEFGRSLSELNVEITVPEDIAPLGIQAGRYDLQRFVYWTIFKCYWNNDIGENASVMTNYDWYHPALAHRHTPEEVESWCRDAGVTIEHVSVVESGTSVRLRR